MIRIKNLAIRIKNFIVASLGVLIFFALITYHLSLINPIHAQSLNIASVYQLDEAEIESGDVIISDPERGFVRTTASYDTKMFGVVDDLPVVVFQEATTSARPVLRAGDVLVNVTDYNGQIKKAEYVTSSPVLGKGMRADVNGYVLGVALADASFSDQTTTINDKQVRSGTVKVALNIGYSDNVSGTKQILDTLSSAFIKNIKDPDKFIATLRYLVAALIAIVVFALGFYMIGRSISKAIEAIGRNPLAKTAIFASVALQVGLTIIGALGAIVAIFLVLRV